MTALAGISIRRSVHTIWDGSGDSPACGGSPCWETYAVIDTDPDSLTFGVPVLDANGNFIRPPNPSVATPRAVIDFWVANPEPEISDGSQIYFITAPDDKVIASFLGVFSYFTAGATTTLDFAWTAPVVTRKTAVNWVAVVSATGDDNPDNDDITLATKVTPGGRGR